MKAVIESEGLEYAIRIYEDGNLIDKTYVTEIDISLSDLRKVGDDE